MPLLNLNEVASNLHCDENGVYYTNDKVVISYPDKGNEYCFALEDDSFWFQHRSAVIVNMVKQFCPGVIFFDVGGGNGFVTKSLQNQKIDAVLVEPGDEGVANAVQRGVNNIIQSTFQDIDFKVNNVNAVGLFDVLEHLENDTNFLQQIKLVMPRDGYIFITVPAYNFLWSNDDVQAGHYRRYNLKSLEKLLVDNGFTVLRKSYLFSFLTLPIFLLRKLPDIFKKAKSEIDFEKHQNIHQPNKILMKILKFMCNVELSYFKKGRNVGIGSSCFVVAKLD